MSAQRCTMPPPPQCTLHRWLMPPTAWPPASLDTTIPLEYPPEKVAMGALWAAVRLVDVTLPLKPGETFAQRFELDQAEVTGGHAAQACLPACPPSLLLGKLAGWWCMQAACSLHKQQHATCSQAGSNAHAVSEQHTGQRSSLSATLQMQHQAALTACWAKARLPCSQGQLSAHLRQAYAGCACMDGPHARAPHHCL